MNTGSAFLPVRITVRNGRYRSLSRNGTTYDKAINEMVRRLDQPKWDDLGTKNGGSSHGRLANRFDRY